MVPRNSTTVPLRGQTTQTLRSTSAKRDCSYIKGHLVRCGLAAASCKANGQNINLRSVAQAAFKLSTRNTPAVDLYKYEVVASFPSGRRPRAGKTKKKNSTCYTGHTCKKIVGVPGFIFFQPSDTTNNPSRNFGAVFSPLATSASFRRRKARWRATYRQTGQTRGIVATSHVHRVVHKKGVTLHKTFMFISLLTFPHRVSFNLDVPTRALSYFTIVLSL